MQVQINNYIDLIEFIQREDITFKKADEVVTKVLNVKPFYFSTNKTHLIENVKKHIDLWGNYEGKKPFFLSQKGIDFNIKDFCNSSQN